MLYHLAVYLQNTVSFFNIFHYVSLRAIGALLSALLFAFILGGRFIAYCQQKFSSKVRAWTPDSHQKKNNTPKIGRATSELQSQR